MELVAALLVVSFAVGVTSWALVAHRGGLRFDGLNPSHAWSARSFDATHAPYSYSANRLCDEDEADRDEFSVMSRTPTSGVFAHRM
jgi:hypothetical protein